MEYKIIIQYLNWEQQKNHHFHHLSLKVKMSNSASKMRERERPLPPPPKKESRFHRHNKFFRQNSILYFPSWNIHRLLTNDPYPTTWTNKASEMAWKPVWHTPKYNAHTNDGTLETHRSNTYAVEQNILHMGNQGPIVDHKFDTKFPFILQGSKDSPARLIYFNSRKQRTYCRSFVLHCPLDGKAKKITIQPPHKEQGFRKASTFIQRRSFVVMLVLLFNFSSFIFTKSENHVFTDSVLQTGKKHTKGKKNNNNNNKPRFLISQNRKQIFKGNLFFKPWTLQKQIPYLLLVGFFQLLQMPPHRQQCWSKVAGRTQPAADLCLFLYCSWLAEEDFLENLHYVLFNLLWFFFISIGQFNRLPNGQTLSESMISCDATDVISNAVLPVIYALH